MCLYDRLLESLGTHAVNGIGYPPLVYTSTTLYKCTGIFRFWSWDIGWVKRDSFKFACYTLAAFCRENIWSYSTVMVRMLWMESATLQWYTRPLDCSNAQEFFIIRIETLDGWKVAVATSYDLWNEWLGTACSDCRWNQSWTTGSIVD